MEIWKRKYLDKGKKEKKKEIFFGKLFELPYAYKQY